MTVVASWPDELRERPVPSSRRAAALAAGLVAPATVERSLMPRSAMQQGLVTGLTALATMSTVRLTQALIGGAARAVVGASVDERWARAGVQAATLAGTGVAQMLLRRRDDERLARAAGRTSAYETALGAGSALACIALGLDEGATASRMLGGRLGDAVTTVGAAGAAVVMDLPARRAAGVTREHAGVRDALTSVAVAAGVTSGALVAGSAEQAASHLAGHVLARVLPGPPQLWRSMSQLAVGAATAALAVRAIDSVLAGIEQAAEDNEAGIDRAPSDQHVSGGPASGVSFRSLSREGRRHVLTRVRATTIEEVMGTVAVAEPVRVFVGLESAPTAEERVALALDEIEQLGALDRSLLVLVSPTGSGYVNHAALQAIELLALGDVSSVVMQYCLRPSFLSLDHVAVGREQNSMLWHALRRTVEQRPPERRPRVVMFGESLGAHTSQDVVMDQGTAGLQALGVDSAVWIGTPFASRWKDQVLGGPRRDVDRGLVGVFATYDEYLALPAAERERVRYVMVTHHEDGVPKFGWPVAVQEPAWIRERLPGDRTPVMRWRPFGTFFQVFVDMLNGSNVSPGVFAALGHDYRADLLDFTHSVYRLDATPEQLASVREALPRFEAILFGYLDGAKEAEAAAVRTVQPTSAAEARPHLRRED